MLHVDLRSLAQGPVDTNGTFAADDPLFEGVDFTLTAPVVVEGRLTDAGENKYYWRGRLNSTVHADCRRCLTSVTIPIAATVDALFTEEAADEDPSVYILPPKATAVDL